jgi:hypothetical protein
MTLPPLRRVKSSFVSGLAYVPLASDLRREHPGKGLLVVRYKSGGTRVYLAPSWLPGVLLSPRVSVGRTLNRFVLHGRAPGAAVEESA